METMTTTSKEKTSPTSTLSPYSPFSSASSSSFVSPLPSAHPSTSLISFPSSSNNPNNNDPPNNNEVGKSENRLKRKYWLYTVCHTETEDGLHPKDLLQRIRSNEEEHLEEAMVVKEPHEENGGDHMHSYISFKKQRMLKPSHFSNALGVKDGYLNDIKGKYGIISYLMKSNPTEDSMATYNINPKVYLKQVDDHKGTKTIMVIDQLKSGATMEDIEDHPQLSPFAFHHRRKIEEFITSLNRRKQRRERVSPQDIRFTFTVYKDGPDQIHSRYDSRTPAFKRECEQSGRPLKGIEELIQSLGRDLQRTRTAVREGWVEVKQVKIPKFGRRRPKRSLNYWIWGETGLGKTFSILDTLEAWGFKGYAMSKNNDWVHYSDGCYDFFYLDEYEGDLSIQTLNEWLDGGRMTLNVKGSNVVKNDNAVTFILSNFSPQQCYPNIPPNIIDTLLRRLRIYHVVDVPTNELLDAKGDAMDSNHLVFDRFKGYLKDMEAEQDEEKVLELFDSERDENGEKEK